MTPVLPCSISSMSLIPGAAFTLAKKDCSTKYNFASKATKHVLSSQRFVQPLSTSFRLFPHYRRGCVLHHRRKSHILSVTGTDVAVEEPNSPVLGEDSSGSKELSSNSVESSDSSSTDSDPSRTPVQPKRTRPGRRSEMPPLKNEELIPGATFTGKVRSIQPFGAFIDFGAFTDGLVHVSRLSDSFVKDVGNFVSIGQEVKVRLVEANIETGRISLSMREGDDDSKVQQQKDRPTSGDKPRAAKRTTSRPGKKREEVNNSKFVRGQDLEGTVKNLGRSGSFISLPEGEEGFLPTSEEADDGLGSMMGASSLQVGQEVSVRVLRFSRGKVTLTMKKGEDNENLDTEVSQGVVHTATNPFMLAFRKNKDIAVFLDEREKAEEAEKKLIESSEAPEVQEQPMSSNEVMVGVSSEVDEKLKDDVTSSNDVYLGAEDTNNDKDPVALASSSAESVDSGLKPTDKEAEESSETLDTDENSPATSQLLDKVDDDETPDSAKGTSDQALSADNAKQHEVIESLADNTIAKEELQTETPSEDETTAAPVEETQSIAVKAEVDDTKDEVQTQAPVPESAIPSAPVDEKAEPGSEKNGSITSSNDSSPNEITKAAISPALVKQLREETGAGMMDCKKALSETGGDIVKAQEFLRKKGLANADKKASRATAEGRIGSYIHDSRIGVLVEVNCETDFVSRGDIFKELVDDLAMQVAACPQVKYLVTEDVPEDMVNKEKEIEMQKEDLLSKPEQIRLRIVEGRIKKRLDELALLEQPYIKNDKMVVKDFVKQTIATIGENIKVKRFLRYNLGEGLEKKNQDFAAEVAAQTASKSETTSVKEQPAVVEVKETIEKPPAVAISAALVKQLREETGAGMMDCKRALAETGGNLEMAQDYLRKKGLSAADKKSSRIAAEGRIGSYIHDSRIGVLIEVNCETDFVGRNENFKELVDDLAMQVVACPQVQFVSIEDIPESTVSKEKELELQREDLLSKPQGIREKIVEGRMSKRLGELALLEQPFIKNDSVLVKDMIKQTVAALGENIKVRRFARFTLGEAADAANPEVDAAKPEGDAAKPEGDAAKPEGDA